jgi:hypothetical protein
VILTATINNPVYFLKDDILLHKIRRE